MLKSFVCFVFLYLILSLGLLLPSVRREHSKRAVVLTINTERFGIYKQQISTLCKMNYCLSLSGRLTVQVSVWFLSGLA